MRTIVRFCTAMIATGMLIAFLAFMGAINMADSHAASARRIGHWSPSGHMHYARQGDTATVLANGGVLVAGGADDTGALPTFAELYNPRTNSWSLTGKMRLPRMNHIAVLLPDGKVLVAGGSNGSGALTSAELYNPATGLWSLTGSMHVARENFTATLLHNGQVLVTGGDDGHQPFIKALRSAELYNPVTGKWTLTGSMHVARFHQTATLLIDNTVLVAGGDDGAGYNPSSGSACLCAQATASSELYNPAKGTWSKTGNMKEARDLFITATLPGSNGKVLAAGGITCDTTTGSCTVMSSAEIYSNGAWTLTESMSTARYSFIAASLSAASHDILVAGGLTATRSDTDSTEVYNAATGTWSSAANMNIPRDEPTASDLLNGEVLIAGGVNSTGALSSAEVFSLS